MKLYVGARNLRPEGFMTVDIDPTYAPDFLADIRDLSPIADDTADVVNAGHVLEHLEWPDSFKAISEFARVLKVGGRVEIAVPDVGALMRMLLSGESAFHVVGLLYGVGGRENTFEAHRYGFTAGMMIDILDVLGFDKFDWWNSSLPDGSNGWVPGSEARAGMSLNVAATKTGPPLVDPELLYRRLKQRALSDFMAVAAEVGLVKREATAGNDSSKLYQQIGYQLIEARQRIKHLEQP